jgi:hypothetical protein
MRSRRKVLKAHAEHWRKVKAARRLAKGVKEVPLSEYHGRGTGSNPNSWNSKRRCAAADREVAECNAVIDGDERRPAAMICEEKIHVIIVNESIRVRNDLFWNNTCFEAPPMPVFAMEAARRQQYFFFFFFFLRMSCRAASPLPFAAYSICPSVLRSPARLFLRPPPPRRCHLPSSPPAPVSSPCTSLPSFIFLLLPFTRTLLVFCILHWERH